MSKYHSRMAEIEAAYACKEITRAEYLSLKEQAEQGRMIRFIAAKHSGLR